MAHAGRKRKDVAREPSGKVQRPQSEALDALNTLERLRQQSVVLAQPHRNGSDDKWLGSALGRFLISAKCRDEALKSGVEAYAMVKRAWAIAQGAPAGFANPGASLGCGEGPDDETVRQWQITYQSIDADLIRRHGHGVYLAIDIIAYDERDLAATLAEGQKRAIVDGMLSVAIDMGSKPARLTPYL